MYPETHFSFGKILLEIRSWDSQREWLCSAGFLLLLQMQRQGSWKAQTCLRGLWVGSLRAFITPTSYRVAFLLIRPKNARLLRSSDSLMGYYVIWHHPLPPCTYVPCRTIERYKIQRETARRQEVDWSWMLKTTQICRLNIDHEYIVQWRVLVSAWLTL